MNELQEWYQENFRRVEKVGIKLSFPSKESTEYIDGEYGRYMFRFIDRGAMKPDIEIIDAISGETIEHNLIISDATNRSIYNTAIEFIGGLAQ